MHLATPPATLDELERRARSIEGARLGDLARTHGVGIGEDQRGGGAAGGRHAKGKPGTLIELVLGATGGSAAKHDFPELAVELKTLPIDARSGAPLESTYVCRVPASDADRVEWETSWARAKLSCVLFVPIHARSRRDPFEERVVGRAFLWRPSRDEEQRLKADFDEIMGAIAMGGVENLTAHVGEILQCRPKAANGAVRMSLLGPDGEAIETVPRGFYLRPTFTASLLRASRSA